MASSGAGLVTGLNHAKPEEGMLRESPSCICLCEYLLRTAFSLHASREP